ESGKLRLGNDHARVEKPVRTFLKNAEGLGFALGRVPIEKFVRENEAKLFQGISVADKKATNDNVKLLQRLYQITPTDEALKILLDLGFTSASDVSAFTYGAFMRRF